MRRPNTKFSVLCLYCTGQWHRHENKVPVMQTWSVQPLDIGIQILVMVASLVHVHQLFALCFWQPTRVIVLGFRGWQRYVINHTRQSDRTSDMQVTGNGIEYRHNIHRVWPNTITAKHSLGLQWRNLYWTAVEISFDHECQPESIRRPICIQTLC